VYFWRGSLAGNMKRDHVDPESAYRDQWLALLEKNGVSRPLDLQVIAVPGVVAQITKGEPPGSLELDESPGNVLMVNLSPVQALRQVRNQRSFVSNMLSWDMTLMPRGTPSKWSWNSTCDRFDLVVSPDVLGEEYKIDTVDRFLFRDEELANICRQLCREISLRERADRPYVEALAIDIASLLLREYSVPSARAKSIPRGGLTRNNARRVVEYVEATLGRSVTVRELADIAELSTYHFVRMFKRSLDLTPYQYLLQRRVERAKELLSSTPAHLAEVALSTGFGSQSHFTSTFHRAVGATPAEFQRLVAKTLRALPASRPHRSDLDAATRISRSSVDTLSESCQAASGTISGTIRMRRMRAEKRRSERIGSYWDQPS
jgi:AraC family transcriptional regulator